MNTSLCRPIRHVTEGAVRPSSHCASHEVVSEGGAWLRAPRVRTEPNARGAGRLAGRGVRAVGLAQAVRRRGVGGTPAGAARALLVLLQTGPKLRRLQAEDGGPFRLRFRSVVVPRERVVARLPRVLLLRGPVLIPPVLGVFLPVLSGRGELLRMGVRR